MRETPGVRETSAHRVAHEPSTRPGGWLMLATIARRFGLAVLPLGVIGSLNGTPQGYALLIVSSIALALSTD